MKRKEKCKMECMGHLLAGVGIPFTDNEEKKMLGNMPYN
jgi:hypothetical protein